MEWIAAASRWLVRKLKIPRWSTRGLSRDGRVLGRVWRDAVMPWWCHAMVTSPTVERKIEKSNPRHFKPSSASQRDIVPSRNDATKISRRVDVASTSPRAKTELFMEFHSKGLAAGATRWGGTPRARAKQGGRFRAHRQISRFSPARSLPSSFVGLCRIIIPTGFTYCRCYVLSARFIWQPRTPLKSPRCVAGFFQSVRLTDRRVGLVNILILPGAEQTSAETLLRYYFIYYSIGRFLVFDATRSRRAKILEETR